METPVRRMTRSQTGSGPSSAAKPPARLASSAKKKAAPRRALSDLTNDSPISGLMPSSMASNAGCVYESTPRSKLRPVDCSRGEDILRNQVTNLLKKVEGSGVARMPLLSQLQHDPEAFESPMRLSAPTPANTPATGSWPSAQEEITVILPEGRPHSTLKPTPAPIAIASPVCHLEASLPADKCNSYEAVVVTPFKLREINSEDMAVNEEMDTVQSTTRTLQFDSPERKAGILSTSEECTRTLLFASPPKATLDVEEMSSPSSQVEDEDDCGWSVIVNVNSPETKTDTESQEDDFETMNFLDNVLVDSEQTENPDIWARRATPKKNIDDEDYDQSEEYEEFSDDDATESSDSPCQEIAEACEELCRGISHISMGEVELKGLPEFQGKHVRFNYNSDDEIEEEIVQSKKLDSPSKTKLKGFPTPRGKHLRFSDDQDEEDELTRTPVHSSLSNGRIFKSAACAGT